MPSTETPLKVSSELSLWRPGQQLKDLLNLYLQLGNQVTAIIRISHLLQEVHTATMNNEVLCYAVSY
ncbi:hypothetical protein E2C01_046863 [Portunus trituberculatus]|uniref:Uncharacterized protein n=1 Tax=Portunus trituberculatus TaxID=210409 RepID=A0A5B7FZN5_PORTR|nr:hypothetical protein [Portunus trituberculatus]